MNNNTQSKKNGIPKSAVIIAIIIFVIFLLIMIMSSAIIPIIFFKIVGESVDKIENRCTEQVQAEVIENRENVSTSSSHSFGNHGSRSPKRLHSYSTVYRYEYKGKTYEATTNISISKPIYEKGEKVDIKIDPKDPTTIYDPAVWEEYKSIDDILMFLIPLVIIFIAPAGLFGFVLIKKLRKKD